MEVLPHTLVPSVLAGEQHSAVDRLDPVHLRTLALAEYVEQVVNASEAQAVAEPVPAPVDDTAEPVVVLRTQPVARRTTRSNIYVDRVEPELADSGIQPEIPQEDEDEPAVRIRPRAAASAVAARPERRPRRRALSGRRLAATALASLAAIVPVLGLAGGDAERTPQADAVVIKPKTPTVDPNARYYGNETWVASFPEGYYEDSYDPANGDAFVKLYMSQSGNYAYGKMLYHIGSRIKEVDGWIREESVANIPLRPNPNDPAMARMVPLRYQTTIGHNFNGAPGTLRDGTRSTPLTANCDHKFYHHTPDTSDEASDPNAQPVGYEYGPVHYRFTENNNKWVVVRSNAWGWGKMAVSCFDFSKKANFIGGTPI